jgi:hypothetical protein
MPSVNKSAILKIDKVTLSATILPFTVENRHRYIANAAMVAQGDYLYTLWEDSENKITVRNKSTGALIKDITTLEYKDGGIFKSILTRGPSTDDNGNNLASFKETQVALRTL